MRLLRDLRLALVLVTALCLAVSGAAVAQLQTGDLFGKVLDEKKEPLPGVTLTLSGVGAPQIAQSDANGTFRFVGLFPGSYAVKAEMEGFGALEQTGIGVRVAGKTEVEFVMSSEVKETITVIAERPILNPREQNLGLSVTAHDLDKVPTARDPWSLLRQAPGVQVDRVNVGGNESGQQSNFLVGGATAADNQFAVDGVIVSDMAAIGGSASYFDFGAYEEIQITTASTDVAIQTAGVTINQVTKRGTNVWKGEGRYLKTEGAWQSDPKLVENANGDLVPGNQIDGVTEWGANFGGPVMQDHLWLWASYGESDIRNIIGAADQALDHTKLKDTNAKLNFQWGQNSGTLHYWDNNKLKFGRSANFDRPFETTWDQTTPATKWKIEDTQLFGSQFMLSALYSTDDGAFTLHPKGGNADVYQDDDGIWRGSFFIFDQTGVIDQAKIDGTAFFDTGSVGNELKFGTSYRTQENDSISTLPHDRLVRSCIGYGCDAGEDGNIALVEWIRHNVAVKTKYQALWAQDTLTHDRWTVTAGLRYDNQTAKLKPVRDPGVPEAPDGLLPVIDFKGSDAGGLNWKSIVPRLGVTYALGEDRRTLLRGTYSQYAAQLGQWVANYVSPTAAYSYVYSYFTDVNRNLKYEPGIDELGDLYYLYNVNSTNPQVSPNHIEKGFDPYHTDELTFSVQHAFPNNFGISANLVYRKTSDLLSTRPLVIDSTGTERAATAADYVFRRNLTRTLPDGTTVTVPQYRLNDDVSATGGNLLANDDREIEYTGITLGFTKPLSNNWSARGNFTYGDNKIKMGPKFKSNDDPTNVVNLGAGFYGDSNDIFTETSYGSHNLVLIHSKWQFNINGLYQVAPDRVWGFNLGGNLSSRQGYPFVPNTGRSVRTGVQLTDSLGDFRFPTVTTLDMRIEKEVKFNDLGVTFSFDGFNLFNSSPVLQRKPFAPSSTDGLDSSYGVVESLSPRVFRWGVAFHFR